MWKIFTAEKYISDEEIWICGISNVIVHCRGNESISNERKVCMSRMKKRYYKYNLQEWIIAKVEKKYREKFTTNRKNETYPR